MKWADAGQLCFDQIPLIAKPLPLSYWQNSLEWQPRIQLLFADEQRLKSEIDEAMQQFSTRRVFSRPPAGILNFLICCRLLCASDTVNILLAAEKVHRLVPDPQGVTDEEILRWLLIETWNEWRWDLYLKLEALRSLSGPDTFFAAPDVPSNSN